MALTPSPSTSRSLHETSALRIALFTGAYNHIADGVSLTLNRLVDYLERNNAMVKVFAPTIKNPPLKHKGTLIPAMSIGAPGRPDYRLSLGLSRSARAELRGFSPNLVHIATPDLLGYQALKWAKRHNIPVVTSFHTHFSSYLKYYRLDWFEGGLWAYLRHFYRQCEHVYVPTESMIEILREHGIRENLLLWPRGVDTILFNPERRSLQWRREQSIKDDEIIITWVSRLVWEKNPKLFADVIEQLTRRGIPHRSMMVGDGPARAELMACLPNTRFLGHQTGVALATAYASSDLFFFPSDTETFGNVILEAMASGLATVCADATGSRSLVKHGLTGFLAAPRDTKDFYSYTEQLLSQVDLRKQMSQAALNAAMAYKWDHVLARLRGYYSELLNS